MPMNVCHSNRNSTDDVINMNFNGVENDFILCVCVVFFFSFNVLEPDENIQIVLWGAQQQKKNNKIKSCGV